MPDAPTTTPTAARDALVARYNAEATRRETAAGKGDKKTAMSHGGRMATLSAAIRDAELQLAMADQPFEPWEKPHAQRTRKESLTQAAIETRIAEVHKQLVKPGQYETVKVSADQRISALLRAAKARGYTVQDPRKKS